MTDRRSICAACLRCSAALVLPALLLGAYICVSDAAGKRKSMRRSWVTGAFGLLLETETARRAGGYRQATEFLLSQATVPYGPLMRKPLAVHGDSRTTFYRLDYGSTRWIEYRVWLALPGDDESGDTALLITYFPGTLYPLACLDPKGTVRILAWTEPDRPESIPAELTPDLSRNVAQRTFRAMDYYRFRDSMRDRSRFRDGL